MKNKKHNIILLLCTLLPTALHGMKPSKTSRVLRPTKPISTKPVIQPQPKIELPTEPAKKPHVETTKLPQPSKLKPVQLIKPSEPIKSLEPTIQRQTFISPKDRIEHYKALIEDAQKYKLKVKKYNSLIEKIEQAEDFTETEAVNIAELFDVLQAKIELKELTIILDNLMTTAKQSGLTDQDLEKFKKLDINSANDMLTIDIFKEDIDKQITELENLIEKQKKLTKKEPQSQITPAKTPEEIAIEQQIEKELLEGLEKAGQEETTEEKRKTQEQPQKWHQKKIILPKEITESPLKEFKEKEQLRRAEEAAEQKAAEEQIEKELKKDKEEVDQLLQEIDQELTKEQQAEQERLATEAKIKEIEQEQERTVAHKKEQQKLLDEITKYETQLEQFEREHQERQKAIDQLQKEWQDKQTALDLQTQKETEAHATQQNIESAQRKQALKEVKTERQRAERKARKAEQKAQEEQKKANDALAKLQKAETDMRTKEKNLENDTQAIEQLEAELAELKNKHQSIQQAMTEAKSEFTEQKQKIKTQAQAELEQLNQETITKIQEAKNSLQKSKDFIAQNNGEQAAELEALEAKYKEEAAIKQQNIEKRNNEQLARINETYEQELRLIEADLQQFEQKQAQERLETEKAKTEERKKEEEKREKEREQEREQRKKIEKVEEGGGSGEIPHATNIEQPPAQLPTEVTRNEEGDRHKKPYIPITPYKEIPVAPEENKVIEPVVLPQTTSETIPGQQSEESVAQATAKQATEETVSPTPEQPTYYPAGRPTSKNAGRPTPRSSNAPQTQIPPFTPSTSGTGTPSSATSIGGTSTSPMTPYTQRIELQPRPATKEEIAASEAKMEKKVQPQDIVWWEKLLPKWIVQYLGRKDRNLPEQPKTVKPTPIEAPEEEKPVTKETSIIKTIVETIKKPISNAISYIRGLFYS